MPNPINQLKPTPLKTMRWDIALMFALLVACDTAAQLFFKEAATQTGEISLSSVHALSIYLLHLVQNKHIIFGVIAICIAFFTWMAVIAKVDLSKAHLITCLAYVTVPIASMTFLGESMSAKQFVGIVLIIMGAYIAAQHEHSN